MIENGVVIAMVVLPIGIDQQGLKSVKVILPGPVVQCRVGKGFILVKMRGWRKARVVRQRRVMIEIVSRYVIIVILLRMAP